MITEVLQAYGNTQFNKGVQTTVKFVTGAALTAGLFWLTNQSTMTALGIALAAGATKIIDNRTAREFYPLKITGNDRSKMYLLCDTEAEREEITTNPLYAWGRLFKCGRKVNVGFITRKGINPILRGALAFAAFSSGLAALNASRGLRLDAFLKCAGALNCNVVMLYMITNKEDAKNFAFLFQPVREVKHPVARCAATPAALAFLGGMMIALAYPPSRAMLAARRWQLSHTNALKTCLVVGMTAFFIAKTPLRRPAYTAFEYGCSCIARRLLYAGSNCSKLVLRRLAPKALENLDKVMEKYGRTVNRILVKDAKRQIEAFHCTLAEPSSNNCNRELVIVLPGNASYGQLEGPVFASCMNNQNQDWLFPNRVGYGYSSGVPTPEACVEALESLVTHAQQLGYAPSNIHLFARSIGAYEGLALKAKHPELGKLIVDAPFSHIKKTAFHLFPLLHKIRNIVDSLFKKYFDMDNVEQIKLVAAQPGDILLVRHVHDEMMSDENPATNHVCDLLKELMLKRHPTQHIQDQRQFLNDYLALDKFEERIDFLKNHGFDSDKLEAISMKLRNYFSDEVKSAQFIGLLKHGRWKMLIDVIRQVFAEVIRDKSERALYQTIILGEFMPQMAQHSLIKKMENGDSFTLQEEQQLQIILCHRYMLDRPWGHYDLGAHDQRFKDFFNESKRHQMDRVANLINKRYPHMNIQDQGRLIEDYLDNEVVEERIEFLKNNGFNSDLLDSILSRLRKELLVDTASSLTAKIDNGNWKLRQKNIFDIFIQVCGPQNDTIALYATVVLREYMPEMEQHLLIQKLESGKHLTDQEKKQLQIVLSLRT